MKKIICVALSITFSGLLMAQSSSSYKIVNRFHLDGDMGWDYLTADDATNRLYVSHGNMVQVLDLNNGGKQIGAVTGLNGVHGVALADELNKGFISSGRDSTVVVFDLATLTPTARIKVTGANPDAIVYDKFSGKVFTFNGRTDNSTVIDAKTNAITGTINLPGKPEFAVADGKGKIYDNLEDKSEICVINTVSMKVENAWSLTPGEEPSGLAMDKANNLLFSVCDNNLMIVSDALKGTIVAKIPIGSHPDGAGFDASLYRAYSSNGEGTLTVVQETNAKNFTVLANVPTSRGARTCTVDSKTHHIYLSSAQYGEAPMPTVDHPHPRPAIKSGTFEILDVVETK